ncbi:C4-dicarboxylate response regulator DctR (plasmid) [Peptoclostridium acidaminophilum DSM 3953]|uniref:Transcriptional regulatory protein n=1 Tax=Peptoclostridium acidaminophilum DSM 3953 TaxID=1286171 RepID=W8UAK5_PEPAC|nr:response regulator [Peptoclostridium acidaminophilum]AHM57831.1 C4-dicarboxylate response regulator DctR [Peptoclostridium acidaminophilum DSM 3953]
MIRVMIVEDDPMVASINKRYVESIKGFSVIGIAGNGEEALKLMRNRDVDLIILDVYMPRIDGISFLKKLRQNNVTTDVIFVTAAKEIDSYDQSMAYGAVDYLVKPFEYERFKKSLEHYSMRRKILKEKDIIGQEDIDRIALSCGSEKEQSTPKGLHIKTLSRVRGYMLKNKGRLITADEIATALSITKVTVRRYLEYLESIGEIEIEVEYGAVGRPTNMYRHI